MGLFGSSSSARTQVETIETGLDASDNQGVAIALGKTGGNVTITDRGAVKEALDFAGKALEEALEAAQGSQRTAAGQVSAILAEKTPGLSQQNMQILIGAGALVLVVLVFKR